MTEPGSNSHAEPDDWMDRSDPMGQPHPEGMPDLVGLHLGLLDATEAAAAADMARQSDAWRAELERLSLDLKPLAAWTVSEPSADLTARVLGRVSSLPRLRLHPGRSTPRGAARESDVAVERGGSMISLRELLCLAAAIALFVGVFAPTFGRSRAAAQQAACLSNFRELGAASADYASAFDGVFPYAGPRPGPWLAPKGDAAPAGNSRQLFLLFQNRFVRDMRVFNCAARPHDRPMPAELLATANDFTDLSFVSYDTPLWPRPQRCDDIDVTFPIACDRNPQFEGRRFQWRANPNSDSHGPAAGQNTLRADGSADWTTRTTVGPDGDDIMNLADLSDYTGWERPQYKTDAFLVP